MITQSSKLFMYLLIFVLISSIMTNLTVLKLNCNPNEKMFVLAVEKG